MKHILLVEKDSNIQRVSKQALQKKYQVSLTDNEKEISDFLEKNMVDLVLLAYSDQVEENIQEIDRAMVRSGKNKVPVLVLIEEGQTKAEQCALQAGADDFVTKPFLPETILKRVTSYIELNEYRKEGSEAEKFQDAISVSFAELAEFRDEITGGHIKSTTLYFRILLEEVMAQEKYQTIISKDDVKSLLRSAPLHDIGKIGINDDILRKASSLDYKEYEDMKTHTTLGKQAFDKIIKETGGTRWLYLARDIAYCHHERWDGAGYPNGLKGDEIPLYARILTIADVYDALTSRRSYKEALTHEEAMEIIVQGKGKCFDPDLVDIFLGANRSLSKSTIK